MSTKKDSYLPKLGFFGGSFDPPHLGHLSLCRLALQQADLEFLLLCPAYHVSLRENPPLFSSLHRMEMAHLLCQEDERLKLCSLELDQKKTCFTYDTIKSVAKLYLITTSIFCLETISLNASMNGSLPVNLLRWCTFSVCRESSDLPSPPLPNMKMTFMKNPLINLSSSSIRSALDAGELPKNSLPANIEQYILNQNLFTLSLH